MRRAAAMRLLAASTSKTEAETDAPIRIEPITTNNQSQALSQRENLPDNTTTEPSATEESCPTNALTQDAREFNSRAPLRSIAENGNDGSMIDDLDSWDPMSEHYKSLKNTLALKPDEEPECVVTGRMSGDNLKLGKYLVCSHYLRYGSCADGKYCDRLHIDPKSKDKISMLESAYSETKDRICLNYQYLSPQEYEPNSESSLLISVTLAKAPNNFYFIAPYEQMNFTGFVPDDVDFYLKRIDKISTFKTKLQKCHEQLAYLFNHNYRDDNIDDPIYMGQIVACKIRDGRFCRAEVIGLEDYPRDIYTIKLFLLDIGIEVDLPRELIYDIKVGSLDEPPMAVNGRLNLKPVGSSLDWSEDARKHFLDYVKNGRSRYRLCKILNYQEHGRIYTVDLFDLENRSSLADEMVAAGLAEHII